MKTIAIDLGASSGRVVVGHFDGELLSMEEVHRFKNEPVRVGERLYWDILRLFHELKQGIVAAKAFNIQEIQSMAIDSWAVDFGLLDAHGELLGNPYHYRDKHTSGALDEVCFLIGREEIFRRTGIQFLPFNTLYQLYALHKAGSPGLEKTSALLMIPDLLRYFLTGEQKSEATNASTTQFFNLEQQAWDRQLLERLGLDPAFLVDVVEPGSVIGRLRDSLRQELDVPAIPVIAVAEHDTASAVVAVPAVEQDFAYLSCGTWSLLGTELDKPILTKQAQEWNFTNEAGYNSTNRFLKNIMGLWLVQECLRVWRIEGEELTYEEMNALVGQAKPFQAAIDPDHLSFLHPEHMPNQVREYCRESNQAVPQTKGEILRCILESLALQYRFVLERTEQLTGKSFKGLHMVGGGIQNQLLAQFTANALGRPVWAGPTEATVIGNLLVQYITLGAIDSIQEGRRIVQKSFPMKEYAAQDRAAWEEAYQQFCKRVHSSSL